MAETTTISNLPQITIDELTNDTLVPVENVDGTKAANLEQLRKKLNSLYVEMMDADLNELKQDGIYECWGTTLNAPTSEVAAWIIQTAEHEGVVVQNAFGLGTTSYSYVYRRRWNGVSWTAWENKIKTLETVKANVANTVTTNTVQTISATKKISIGGTAAYGRPFEIMMPTSSDSNPTENKAREIAFLSSDGTGNNYEGSLKHERLTDGASYTGLRTGRLVNGTYKEGTLGVRMNADGTTFATAPNTPDNAPANAIVTKNKIANMVTTNTAQTISGSKRFTQPSAGMSIELVADTNQQTVPAESTLRQLGLYRNATYSKGDGYTSWLQAVRGSDGWTATELYARRFLESDSQEIINYLRVTVTQEGVPISYTRTPPAVSAGEEIVTAGWFNTKMQVVSALPAAPDANVFYFIPG